VAASALLAFLPIVPAAAASPQAQILRWGNYAVGDDFGPLPSRYRQQTLSDVEMTDPPRFLTETDHIVARLCTRFGVEYRISDAGTGGVLTVRVTHPRQERPDGKSATVDEFDTPLGADSPKYTGFEFDYPWELVPGTWTFTLLIDGRVIGEKSFTVTVPPDARSGPGCAKAVS
jgi:hypothetical protein